MLKPLNQLGFKRIENFMITDFSLLADCIRCGVTATEFRIWSYAIACHRHEMEIDITDAAEYLELTEREVISALSDLSLINFFGGNENA